MSMSIRPDLPASSPFRRNSIAISCHSNTGHPEPLYVVPLQGAVVLASSEEVLAVLWSGNVQQLTDIQALQAELESTASDTNASTAGATKPGNQRHESRCEPVLLEEQTLLTELERLSKQAPDLISSFQSGELSINHQITYALRLMHVAETMMIHGKARERVAGEQGNR
jgi:hypothetical protein